MTVPGFLRPSQLSGRDLQLQTAGGASPAGPLQHPRFFSGHLVEAEQGARGLLAVAAVARSRYYTPVTAQSLASRDPVVTSDGSGLRFESFSGCCGVYARLDVLEQGLDGDLLERGTTNVDVDLPLQTALAEVGGREPLHLAVGPDDLTVSTLGASVVERRVALPQRWLRGFAEAPVALAGMRLRAEVDAAEARRFLRGLPRSGAREALWVVPSGRGLRLTTRATAAAVCLAGPVRLEHLQPLLRSATALRLYGPDSDGAPVASAWEVALPGARLTLTLSPDAARGFSGEGGVLDALADGQAAEDADAVDRALAWLPGMSLQEVAVAAGLEPGRAARALQVLGTAGRTGYDVADGRWFGRELPYGTPGAQAPRLVRARALVAQGRVVREGDVVVVRLDDHVQHVRTTAAGPSCTCTWWTAHRGGRGPCAHVLAAGLLP